MPLSFPSNPSVNQTSTQNGRVYRWSGSAWEFASTSPTDDARWSLFLPPAPTGLTATAGNAQVALAWTAPTVLAQTPITDYIVQFKLASASTWETFADGTSTATSATVTGLTNGSAYVFRVAAVNGVGTGSPTAATGSVTPVDGDPFWSSVALLLHMDGSGSTFVDSSATPKTVTAYDNATQSTLQSRWGGKSALFDGSDDYLEIASSAALQMPADFVYEWWFRSTDTKAYSAMLTRPYNGPGGILIAMNGGSNDGRPVIFWREFENALFIQSDTGGFNDGAWHHFAFVRSGTDCRMYIDGVSRGSRSGVSTTVGQSAIYVGSDRAFAGRDFAGNIDDLRITVNSARGYTGATITVPTAAFPDQ